jgi:hypothetical protein
VKGSPLLRWGLGALLAVVLLGVLRAKPWQRGQEARESARQKLSVGFLPVT